MESNGARAAVRLMQLRRRIERWRSTRARRSPMPAALWSAATQLAHELGASRVARELRVGYGSLKERVEAGGQPSGRGASGFVQIEGAALLAAAPPSVEFCDPSGLQVTIRLGAGQAVDWAALVAALRSAGR
jgi:hypothetical protein